MRSAQVSGRQSSVCQGVRGEELQSIVGAKKMTIPVQDKHLLQVGTGGNPTNSLLKSRLQRERERRRILVCCVKVS